MEYRRTMSAIATGLVLLTACTSSDTADPPKQEQQVRLVQVPELTNQQYFRVKKLIASANLEVGNLERVGNGTRGTVLEQDPSAGTAVPQGTPINIVVSKVFPAPLLTVPNLGTFAWRCRRNATDIIFTVDPRGASTRVTYPARPAEERSKLVHPGHSVAAARDGSGSHRWRLVQRTKPRTVTATVSIQEPRTCLAYLPPRINFDLRAKSHSTL